MSQQDKLAAPHREPKKASVATSPDDTQSRISDENMGSRIERATVETFDPLASKDHDLALQSAVQNTSVCPKCGQQNFNIPRMGIFHVCPENGEGSL